MERKKIFLMGGTGFIGSALTCQLAADPLANNLMMLIHRRARLQELEQINTYTGDLRTFDLSLIDQFAPDTIVHLARISGRRRLGRYLAGWTGARANNRIIAHLRRRPFKPQTIYVSGTLVYGNRGDAPADEESPIRPIAFAREYIKAELPWMKAQTKGELPVTIVRPPWIIGPGSWFAEFYLSSIRHDRTVPLFGDGLNLMSLIDVEDCAGLIAHAVRNSAPGRCYNLFVPGTCLTQLEFAERLAKLTQCRIRKLAVREIQGRFGRAVVEAFTFSNRSATQYPDFIAGYNFRHPSVEAMIMHNLPADLGAPAQS